MKEILCTQVQLLPIACFSLCEVFFLSYSHFLVITFFMMLIYFSIMFNFFRNNFLFDFFSFLLNRNKTCRRRFRCMCAFNHCVIYQFKFSTIIDILFLSHSLTGSLVFLIYYIVYYMHGSRRTNINSTDKLFSIWIANGKWQIYYI